MVHRLDALALPAETLQAMRLALPAGTGPNPITIVLDVFGGPQAVSLSVEAQMHAIAGY